jgi:hypothetical protein
MYPWLIHCLRLVMTLSANSRPDRLMQPSDLVNVSPVIKDDGKLVASPFSRGSCAPSTLTRSAWRPTPLNFRGAATFPRN